MVRQDSSDRHGLVVATRIHFSALSRMSHAFEG
jgi:hypothetical protein